jgi:ABC-2 type transport system permease protein
MSRAAGKGSPRNRGAASDFVGSGHTELNALFGFAERQMHVVKRYWVWEVVWLFYSLVSVLSIGYLASGLGALGAQSASFDLHRAQLYLLIGALLWGYLSLVFMEAAYAIAWERWEGTIEYTFMAPVKRITHLMGICLFAIGYGLARTFVVLIVAVVMFKLDFSHADIPAALAVLAASTVPLIGLSIFTSVLPLLSPQKGEQMSIALQGFLLLVSGVYYPLTVLLSMGAVMIPVSILVFGWAENRAKRLGLLKRSG